MASLRGLGLSVSTLLVAACSGHGTIARSGSDGRRPAGEGGLGDAVTRSDRPAAPAEGSVPWVGPPDCTSVAAPTGFSRIYIADRRDGIAGTGTATDPFDGSSATKLDTLLRTRSEGGVTDLVVCIGPGTFATEGRYDYVMYVGHVGGTPRGFTVAKNWRLHGSGVGQTTLQLADMYTGPASPTNPNPNVDETVVTTYTDMASGVQVTDLTIDDNYAVVQPLAKESINLEAISLRNDGGGNLIQSVHVMNATGMTRESFPISIGSVNNTNPNASTNNVVDLVTEDHWQAGGMDACTLIALYDVAGEVHDNSVTGTTASGAQVGYGGWKMGVVDFHNNTATNMNYGFNIDSLANDGVLIENNVILDPQNWGIVIGGGGTYANFQILGNTITLHVPSTAIIFQGNVTGARVANNTITEDATLSSGSAMWLNKGTGDTGNLFQSNQVYHSLGFSPNPVAAPIASCLWGNHDEKGNPLPAMPNSGSGPCF